MGLTFTLIWQGWKDLKLNINEWTSLINGGVILKLELK